MADNSETQNQNSDASQSTQNQDDSNLTKDSYSKEDVSRLLRQVTVELKTENEKLRKDLGSYTSKIDEFSQFQSSMQEAIQNAGLKIGEKGFEVEEEEDGSQDFLEEYSNPPKGVNPKFWKDFKRFEIGTNRLVEHLTNSNKTLAERTESLMQAIEAEKQERARAEDRARVVERNSLLDDALVAANCIDVEGGRRYFKEQTAFVQGKGWMFVPPNALDESDYLPMREGIKRHIPTYFVRSAARTGGSGSTSSTGDTNVSPAQEIAALKTKAEELFKAAQGGNSNAQQSYMTLRRQIRELERKQAQSAGSSQG